MAARISSSEQVTQVPMGGISPRPVSDTASICAMPWSMRGCHCSRLPNRGASPTPVLWQAKQKLIVDLLAAQSGCCRGHCGGTHRLPGPPFETAAILADPA